jgi:hypothetical protein
MRVRTAAHRQLEGGEPDGVGQLTVHVAHAESSSAGLSEAAAPVAAVPRGASTSSKRDGSAERYLTGDPRCSEGLPRRARNVPVEPYGRAAPHARCTLSEGGRWPRNASRRDGIRVRTGLVEGDRLLVDDQPLETMGGRFLEQGASSLVWLPPGSYMLTVWRQWVNRPWSRKL